MPRKKKKEIVTVPPGAYDYAGKCGLQLEREVEQQASREFEELAVQLREEDEERRRLWGNKFPPVRGMTPDDLQDPKRKGVRLRPIPFYRKNAL